MKLSEHFNLKEFTATSHKELMAAQEEEVKAYIPTIKTLCLYILEPLRKFYNAPITVTSGFRGKTLNAKSGGAGTSQHCSGQAADIIIKGMSNEKIIDDLKSGRLSLHFGQAIDERVNGKEWLHISLGYPFRLDKPCMQILKTIDGRNYETA
jgi:Uncharacterized protein conserved in bacteria